MTTKSRIDQSPKSRDSKRVRAQLDKAVRRLQKLKREVGKLEDVQFFAGKDNVIVKVRRDEGVQLVGTLYEKSTRSRPTSGSRQSPDKGSGQSKPQSSGAHLIGHSLSDTDRAVRTLKSKPSPEVNSFYERLASSYRIDK